jgi:glycosyltransferase involved in cell wall biosynthesis
MRSVVCLVQNYPPVCLGGAEFAAHNFNKLLLSHGYSVRVFLLTNENYPTVFEGVPITVVQNFTQVPVDSNTILISQLWAAKCAHTLFEMKNPALYIECIHYVDRTVLWPYPWTAKKNIHYVFNSQDTRRLALEIAGWLESTPHSVIPPLCVSGFVQVRTQPEKYPWITLVNFSEDKGASIFNGLAERDPEHAYVAVRGSHGSQCVPNSHVTLLEPTLDMESVYAQTRILVVPSTYETWSMVASEANARGIPVVASDAIPALKENCGDAALYVERMDHSGWLAAFKTIEANYEEYSKRAINRRYNSEDAILALLGKN